MSAVKKSKAVDKDLNYSTEPALAEVEVYLQIFTRPVRFDSIAVADVFASFYPTYADQALAIVHVANDDAKPVEATLRFELPGLLHHPFEEALTLAPGSTQTIQIKAPLDPTVLQRQETMSVQAKIQNAIPTTNQPPLTVPRRDRRPRLLRPSGR